MNDPYTWPRRWVLAITMLALLFVVAIFLGFSP
jgi:hypothetical protein